MSAPIDQEPGPGTEPAGHARGGTPAWALVARREVVVKLTDRAFLIGTLATLVVLVAALGFQAWQDGRTSTYDVVVSTGSEDTTPAAVVGGVGDRLAERASGIDEDVSVTVDVLDDAAAAERAVADERADAWLRPTPIPGGTGDDTGWVLVGLDDVDADLEAVATTVVREDTLARNAADAGTSVQALTAGTGLSTDQLRGDARESTLRDVLGFVFAMLFYVATLLFGYTLANSVLEEKQSRLAEMIAAAIPVRQLLAGKVLGNTVLALGQMALYVAVGVLGLSFTEFADLLPGISGAIGWFLVFFLAGFVAIACLWAAAGALASRTEDLQSTTGPATMLVLGLFFGALFLEGPALTVASFVPPLSALLMPIRLVDGGVAWWEPVLALVLLVVLGAALVVLAERIYRRALLQTQGRLTMRQAWRVEE